MEKQVGLFILALVLMFMHTDGQTAMTRQTCDRIQGNQAIIEPNADAFIVGFFGMHSSGPKGVGCGGIRYGEMQSYEAIRWALDRLNKKGEFLNLEFLNDYYIPGVRIGMIANDYCSNPDMAISMAESIFPQYGSSPHECQKNTNKLMLGLMGASNSGDTKVLAKYAESRQLPLVSWYATAPELSDSGMFPNFLRTIPPDGPLTKTIADFIKNIKWEYVTVVYTDDAYGLGAYKAIRPHLAAVGICLTSAISVDPDDNSDASVDAALRSVLQTNTTGVIYLGNDLIINAILKRAEAYPNAGRLQWVVTDSVSLSDKFSGQKYPKGLVSVVPASRKITEFEDHWVRINNNVSQAENPWYQDMYMEQFRCRLPGKTSNFTNPCPVLTEDQRRNDFVQDQFVEPAVHAVFTYARALKNAHGKLCGTSGMCAALRSLSPMDFYTNYMRPLEFIYGKAERVESLASYSLDPYNAAARVKYIGNDINNPSFEVFSFNGYPYEQSYRFWSVATYINQLLEVLTVRLKFYNEARDAPLLYIPTSPCPSSPCTPCLGAIVDPKYVYIPGDVVITSAFSVHPAGETPFSCGKFDLNSDEGIQAMQAFIFAIDYINNDVAPGKGWLKGVRLGGLGFDDCGEAVISNQLITEVHRYSRAIRDSNSNNLLDPRSVEAFLAPRIATDMTQLMNTLKRPIIGVQTLSTKFNDFQMYPYFVRATYDLEYVSRAFVNIAKKNGWRYVQVVFYADEEGNEANVVFRRVAAQEGICVISSFHLYMDNAIEVVSGLRKRMDVQPVVLFLRRPGMQLLARGLRAANSKGEFQFMSASGNSMKAVQGHHEYFKGMISFELWNAPALDAFQGRLKVIDARNYVTNPWLKEWYELFYNCSLSPLGGQKACQIENMFANPSFELNTDNIAVIYGVIAAAQGLDETLKHYCGAAYNGLCGEFLNARDKGEIFVDNIVKKTRYPVNSNIYTFNSMRMGNIPYVYYNFGQFNNIEYEFKEIGEYGPSDDKLTLATGVLINDLPASRISSNCSGICLECQYLFVYQKYMYVEGDLIIPAIFDIHYRGIAPYSCSSLRMENGFQYSEAFRFALMKINSGLADIKLNGVRLGGLGFDGCTDHIRASAVVTGIYSGADNKVDTGNLMGWLLYDSQTTVDISRILQRQGVPSVTPGATTPVLDDKSKFTTFFRTIPSDGRIALAMAKLSNLLGFSYVITLNAPESGSQEAVKTFREHAEGLGICVGASYEFATDGDISQIFSYINESPTSVVVVFASPDMYIEDLIREKAKSNKQIIFITNHPWTSPVKKVKPVGESIIPATISFNMDGLSPIIEFMQYLEGESRSLVNNPNPWFREYFEAVMQCNLAGTSKYPRTCDAASFRSLDLNRITQDLRVIPTINAVYSIAEGIHRTLQTKCGANYTSICPAFRSDEQIFNKIMANMDAMSFMDVAGSGFNFINREANRKLTITQIQTDGVEKQVGTFEFGELDIPLKETLMENYRNVPSTCVGECSQCKKDSSGLEEFIYVAGDVHIAALFDIHKMGGTPYTCGDINSVHGFQLMEAFNWSMNYVNSKQGIFHDKLMGVKLGSLIFDICSSPVRAGNLVANYHARNFQIRTTDYKIDPSLIDLYIGPMTSEASIRVADVLNELGIPQIGYGASSVELMDRDNYPYFIRTVPADDKQARALIAVLKKYQFNNIQLISQNSSDGEYARDEFLRLAPLNKICVSGQYVVGQDGNIKADDARLTLHRLQQKPDARVVVVIMNDPTTLLQEANKLDFIIKDGFAFIATDKLGFGMAGYENLAGVDRLIGERRLITLEVESADYPEVDAFFENIKPNKTNDQDKWFREFYEHIYNCSINIPTPKFPRVCNQYTLGYSRAEKYIQDPYTLYVINAVFAAALGIDKTIVRMCGRFNGICPILLDNGEKRNMFLEDIKTVSFIDRTNQPFYFTEDGSSDRGFHLYEPQKAGMSLHSGADGYYWEDIGSYNDSHYLKMDVEYKPTWVANCSVGQCLCEFPGYQPSRYMKKPSPNDLNIVFVSDIHNAQQDGTCGSIDTGSNMQNLLAFLYAIELVNANKDLKFQASLKLGGVALDTCSQPNRIGEDVYSLLSGEPFCSVKDGGQVVSPSTVVAYMVSNSANSIALSSMLSPLQITSVSMSATTVELNDKLQHQYFLRTVPPDNIQAMVIAQILKKFSWDYVSIVYSDNTYGRSARDTLLSLADPENPEYCFHKTIAMPLNGDLTKAKSVIDQLNQQIGSRVVVTFVNPEHVTLLLQATTEKGLNHRFIWIGSDTWANNYHLINRYEEAAAGALTIQIRSEYSEGFKNFVKRFNYSNPMGLPRDWFEDIYQTVHQCRILGSAIQKAYTSICTGTEKFTDEMINQDAYVLHTIMAVFQIANGLNQIDQCRQSTSIGIASCLSTLKNRKQTIYDSVLNAQHDVLPSDLKDRSFNFKFTPEGYGEIGYNIYNFRRNLTSGQYEYIKIGSSTGDLRLDPRDYKSYSFTDQSLPVSRCQVGTTCTCEGTNNEKFSFSREESGEYVVSKEGQYADPNTGRLVTIVDTPQSADRFKNIWGVIVATLAAIGAFATLCMFIYLLVVYPVRGGTTILGYMLCFGIILMYILVFAFIVHASEKICGLRRFSLGFVYSIAYSALFVKLIDCWRTKDKEDIYLVKYNKIGNPWGLFFSACLLVLVQVMINAEWLILEAPNMERVIYNNMLWPRCTPDDFYDEGLIMSNIFIMFLIFLSIIVGLFAFGNEKNHWDCRWLTGCVVLTVPCWMVWCLVAALGEYKTRDAAVAIGLLYNATVMLMCGPFRKLYLLHKYQALVEEEERKSARGSQRDYNSMYGAQYDNAPHMLDNGSTLGHDDVFAYDAKM